MRVNPDSFQNYLATATYKDNGDDQEQKYGHFLAENFPNCEKFWRIFVVPLTKRMTGYPNKLTEDIYPRDSIDPEIQDIAAAHYSMFMNLVFSHLHAEKPMPSSIYSIYAHLASVCDLAEMTLEKWYLSSLKCRGQEIKLRQPKSHDEFIEIAERWFDEKYAGEHKYYLKRGRHRPINFFSDQDLLVEYFGKNAGPRTQYLTRANIVRHFRNVIVHDVQVAGFLDNSNGRKLMPKPEVIDRYRSWRDVFEVAMNSEIIKRDFVEQYPQALEDIQTLEHLLNQMWDRLIKDYEAEFYSERTPLRGMYDLEFSAEIPDKLNSPDELPEPTAKYPLKPGTHGSASIRFPTNGSEP